MADAERLHWQHGALSRHGPAPVAAETTQLDLVVGAVGLTPQKPTSTTRVA